MNLKISVLILGLFLPVFAQSPPAPQPETSPLAGDKDTPWTDLLAKWDTQCVPRGCILFTDILHGSAEDPTPPDPKDEKHYITIAVALRRPDAKPDYFAFHIPPVARRDQGVFIAFGTFPKLDKSSKGGLDSDGAMRLDFVSCDADACIARVPDGIVRKDAREVDLRQKFLTCEFIVFLYLNEGRPIKTMVPLSGFKKEYKRVVEQELVKKP